MTDAAEKEKPVERESEGVGFFTSLKMTFSDAATHLISPFSQEARIAVHLNNIRDTANPGTNMMNFLAQVDGFKEGQPGHDKLAKIAGDKEFMSALDKAMRSDKTIMNTILDSASADGEDGMEGVNNLVDTLGNEHKRGLMTKVLNVVAKDDNDGFGAKYLGEVIDAGQKQDLGTLDGLLEQGGISDDLVKMGADPSQIFSQALKDPKAFGESMSKMMGLEGEQGKSFAKLFEMLGQILQAVWGNTNDPNSFAYFFDKHGAGMQKGFEDLAGMTDEKRAEAAKASKDNPDIKVEAGKRPTNGFNDAANDTGTKAAPAPAQEPSVWARIGEAQVNAAKYGMGGM